MQLHNYIIPFFSLLLKSYMDDGKVRETALVCNVKLKKYQDFPLTAETQGETCEGEVSKCVPG